jgi:AraC-like DNA-binding protein
MPRQNSSSESPLPLLRVLQKQIKPAVQESGMNNIIVARRALREMYAVNDDLPSGASLTHKPLQSKRVPVKVRRQKGDEKVAIDARWPKDRLESKRVPILMFVVSGRVAIPLGDYVAHCRPGHGVLILPGTPHPAGSSHLCLEADAAETGECSMLSFKTGSQGIIGWLNQTRGGRHWVGGMIAGERCHILRPQARHYLEMLAEEATARRPHFRSMCDNLLQLFITLLLREIEETRTYHPPVLRRTPFSLEAPPASQKYDPIARVEEYVRNHLSENLSIDNAASYVFMSRAAFTRQFRAVTGKTFNQYVIQCRIEAAKVLLQNTEWPVIKICEYVGATPLRLRVLFNQHEKCSPVAFRQKSQEKSSIR